ncbi:endo-1,4-beta-xylanase [Spirosoma fluviale]|nr:endo-1,4-beta-xylanase [Spirosoma fluviale]
MTTSTSARVNNKSNGNSYFSLTVRSSRVAVMITTFFSIALNLISCSPRADSVQPEDTIEVYTISGTRITAGIDSNSTLKSVAPFPIGAAINPRLLSSIPLYKETLQREYNSVSSENCFKMNQIQPKAGGFYWKDTDALVNFAKESNMRVHGHTLIYYKSLPEWVTSFQGDSLAWENLMKTHIQTVVGRYKGVVTSWDVVNEAFEDDGTLRRSVWYEKLGADYIARCFQYAHQADPRALLFYNENVVGKPKKLTAVLALVNNLKKRGIAIHGIGVQMHININTSEEALTTDVRQFVNTGLLVHISELDIRMNPTYSTNFTLTNALQTRHALKYKNVAKLYRSVVPKSQQFGITNWNVGDADSWLRKTSPCEDYPLLFSDNYSRKPAYYGFIQGLTN